MSEESYEEMVQRSIASIEAADKISEFISNINSELELLGYENEVIGSISLTALSICIADIIAYDKYGDKFDREDECYVNIQNSLAKYLCDVMGKHPFKSIRDVNESN